MDGVTGDIDKNSATVRTKRSFRPKLAILHLAKRFGLFGLARLTTATGLRVLCYHGFSHADEHRFRRQLFITREAFAQRLELISTLGFKVLSLNEAIVRLKAGATLRNCLVITIDDGWQSTEDIALPLLEAHNYPWTLYLTSYYAEKQTQIMNVVLQYMCWKTTQDSIDLASIDSCSTEVLPLASRRDREYAATQLVAIGESRETAEDRQAFVGRVAALLCVDQQTLEEKRMFHILNEDSVRRMSRMGIDIQLHTHRHSLHGVSRTALIREIQDNRNFIERATGLLPRHFCYPSGIYDAQHLAWLAELGVESATTCKPGLNYHGTPVLELNRFLDGDDISVIEFEAELSGFLEIARFVRSKFYKLRDANPLAFTRRKAGA